MSDLTFEDYQRRAHATAAYRQDDAKVYTILGLASEAGEVAALMKRSIRDHTPPSELEIKMLYEIGDCLWYLSECASAFGWSLSAVAQANLDKLASRAQRGVIHGEGGER